MAKKPVNNPKKSNTMLWVAAALVIMSGIIWFSLRTTGTSDPAANATAQLEKPAVETLSPEQFQGKAREAYQAAKEVPAVLAKLPCYCGCMKNMGHLSNLYCFADYHGADCDMCQDIAIEARDMYRSGTSIDDIRAKIIAKYSQYAQSE